MGSPAGGCASGAPIGQPRRRAFASGAPIGQHAGAMIDHPLDPLTADEIRQAAAILRRDQGVTDRWRFASMELREPAKAAVREYAPGTPFPREARVVCWNRDDGKPYRALVSLTD